MDMKRREIIKYTSLATGAALGMPLMSALMSGCKTDEIVEAATDLKLFSQTELNSLKQVIDIILPKTDSPSASEVGVHTMIDHMLGFVLPAEQRNKFKPQFDALIGHLQTGGFFEANDEKKLSSLSQISKSNEVSDDIKQGLLQLKQQTIAYYLSSEKVAENYLNYLPVPGNWEPCISLEEAGGKKWAI